AEGIIAGQSIGGIVFGVISVLICFKVIDRAADKPAADLPAPAGPPTAQSPFTSGKGATAGQ
ncbi:hypothetical protein, partial [Klebsiella pneumoniae]|uniref:hypothetical protein n=1 Tax=Klebsiella pneumoniae TaxID=573 RepID=UPI001953666A